MPAELSEGGSGSVFEVDFSPDGTLMAAAIPSGGTAPVVIRATTDWSVLQTLTPNLRMGSPYAVRFHPAGTQLAVGGSGTDGAHPALFIYSVGDWSLLYSMDGEDLFINGLSYNHDGSLLATAGLDTAVSIYNPNDGSLVQRLTHHSGSVGETAFNQDGTLLATAGRGDGNVLVYNTADWTSPLETLDYGASGVMTVKFSPDGTLLAAGDAYTSKVVVWKVEDWTVFLESQPETSGRVWDVDFSPDGQWLASASGSHKAHLWSMGDGSLAGPFDFGADLYDVTFSPNSDLLLLGSQSGITHISEVVACTTTTESTFTATTSTFTATTSTLTATTSTLTTIQLPAASPATVPAQRFGWRLLE